MNEFFTTEDIIRNTEKIKGRIDPGVIEINLDQCIGKDYLGYDLEYSHTVESRYLISEACKAIDKKYLNINRIVKDKGQWFVEVRPDHNNQPDAEQYYKIADSK